LGEKGRKKKKKADMPLVEEIQKKKGIPAPLFSPIGKGEEQEKKAAAHLRADLGRRGGSEAPKRRKKDQGEK